MTTDQVLFGLGLILVLAVGSQVLASRLRIPARRDPSGSDLLFLVRANGILAAVTQTVTFPPQEGDIMILLSPATTDS